MFALDAAAAPPAGSAISRRAGLILLAAAVLLTVTVSGLFNAGVVGSARRGPYPPPPAVGACLLVAPHSLSDVGCLRPHNAEVIAAWDPGVDSGSGVPAAEASFAVGDDAAGSRFCARYLDGYLGPAQLSPPGLWAPASPRVDARYITAPLHEPRSDQRWSACVLTASNQQPYVGSVGDAVATPGATVPDAFRTCVMLRYLSGDADCRMRHRAEILGRFQPTAAMVAAGSAFVGLNAAELQASCQGFAAAVTGVADPSFAGQLEVTAGHVFSADRTPSAFPDCFVEVVHRGTLTSTVIGLRDAQLPLS